MEAIQIIKEQEMLGNKIVSCYNSLSSLVQSDVDRQELSEKVKGLRESFRTYHSEFEKNDKNLRPPSSTLERNAYFKSDFVDKVRQTSQNFESLYQQVKGRLVQEERQAHLSSIAPSAPELCKEKPTNMEVNSNQPHTEVKIKNNGLVRQFQYVLDDLESKINKYKSREISSEIVKNKYDIAEKIFLQYMGEFPDDELTEIFYSLRDLYQEIPEMENSVKSLPFTLPSIDIPTFDGKFTEWETFRELFEQLIIAQPIPKIQKMCILKSKLSGEAIKKISKLPSREENFDVAWNILNSFYANNRAMTSIYFKSILDAPFVKYNTRSVKNFLEIINESLQALNATNISPQEMHQAFLCYVLQRKLDDHMRIQFESYLGQSRELPKVDKLIEFLQQMHYSLEASNGFVNADYEQNKFLERNKKTWEEKSVRWNNNSEKKEYIKTKCFLGCLMGHSIFRCSKFRSLPVKERLEQVKKFKLCYKCLGSCQNSCDFKCKICRGNHSTLLHEENVQKTVIVNNEQEDEDTVMLSTAVVQIKTGNNKWIDCRVLLDGGSQLNIITDEFKRKLKLNSVKVNKNIEGLGMKKSSAEEKVGINLRSKVSDYKAFLNAVVMKRFVSNIPATKMMLGTFPKNIQLADPKYNIPKGIDLLLSNQFVFDLICEGKIEDKASKTKLQNTKLGWVAYSMRRTDGTKAENKSVVSLSNCEQILEKFWKLEEVPQLKKITKIEEDCEKLFEKNIKRSIDGKLEVRLPFKDSIEKLGNSKYVAKRRFITLERKLEKNPELKNQYCKFMREYLEMGHMKLVQNISLNNDCYFLPHHCVLRPESTTTKLRVVFDASCKTTSNISLNDILHTGPRIQEDLFNILLRFRKHRYVFSADIEKMYRQIWVAESDRRYQQILWRWNQNEKLDTYALSTVTYGTASAPYLAVKCLQKIADWKTNQFPKESEIIKSDFYMDDLMTGGNSLEEVKSLRENIDNILLDFGMPLRKWCSNNKFILENIDENKIESNFKIETDDTNVVKALGVIWNPQADKISLKCNMEKSDKVSKRTILSEISKLFDPLGLVGPVVVSTKILLQELWKSKIDWDENITDVLKSKWVMIRDNLSYLNEVSVPRHIICIEPTNIELHGFCDASMKAYGAVVYVKSTDRTGKSFSYLAASKSRVAPIKVVTLPRLELCAGVLLVELMKMVVKSLKIDLNDMYFYTDSTIVLSWLKLDPASLQIFVSNRVSLIQENSDIKKWRHVRSEENPADLISRGLLAKEIRNNELWFEGPKFLKQKDIYVPLKLDNIEVPDIKKVTSKIILARQVESIFTHINHRNRFNVLQNIIAYVFKFIHRVRKQENKSFLFFRKEALTYIVKNIQENHFSEEIKMLRSKRNLLKSSNLITLSPFIDNNGIIRVGGRLENSDLLYEAKHPILLPYKDKVVELLIDNLHREHLHIGPQGLLAITRQQFWPLRGRQLVKKIVNRCYRCFKLEPRQLHQFMGNLPEDRVIRTRPFLNVGIDFLGPITIHYKIRGKKTDKAYVCVFVCFATKAVHLEVVADLTSASFIGALKRFVARRGAPSKIVSDNATNFVGAANSLNEIYKIFNEEEHIKNLDKFCATKRIEWLNIPARSPHVGGLWEACVKSVKKHFYKVTEGTMTYEELYTLMTQIESILNSRPLTALSDDPNDLNVLTPGHFLIGESLTTFQDNKVNKSYQGIREHWKAVQSNTEEFWNRWSSEYLSELQKRYKWNKPSKNIIPGTLVLLKEDNVPPMSWRRGRVIRTILGSDGLCRMVDVRTSNGETKRSIHNVCPFPTEEDENLEKPSRCLLHYKRNELMESPSIEKENVDNSHLKTDCRKNETNYKVKNKNMLIILLSFLSIITPVRSSTNIKYFNNKAGIFFEKVATVGLSTNSWDLLVHINMTDYRAAKVSLDEAMASFSKLRGKEVIYSSSAGQNLQSLYERIVNRHEVIMSSAADRKKRSLLPSLGGVQYSLFGLMDEEHAAQMAERIQLNSVNNKELMNYIKNLSSIQDITTDVLKKENKVVFKNILKLSNSIKSLEADIHDMKDESISIAAITNILMSVEIFEKVQDDIINALLNTKGNFMHHILPVDKFRQQIRIIKNSINKRLRLPSENLLELAKVSQVSSRVTDEFVLFNIRIPLINSEVLQAYEVYTYPVFHDGLSTTIYRKYRYFLIDERKTSYYNLNEGDFEHCHKMEKITVCHQIHPMFYTRSETSCEVQLFLKAKTIPDNCEIEIKKVQNYWRQTKESNTWIFSLKEDTSADVTCMQKTESIVLHGSGILKMQSDCHLETAEVNLWAYDSYASDVNYIFPMINMSNSLPSLKHIQINGEMEIYKIPDIPTTTNFLGFSTSLDVHHLAHYGISTTTIIITFIIIIAVLCIIKRLCRMTSTYLPATVALPRIR